MAKINPVLLAEIIKASGKSKRTIYQKIHDAENKYVIDESISALLVAWEHKININKLASFEELKVLRETTQSQLYNKPSTETINPSNPPKRNKRQKAISVPQGVESDSFLTLSDISNSSENAQIYPIMYLFENSLRKFISTFMELDYGENWWIDKIVKEKIKMARDVEIRRNAEKIAPWHSKRNADSIYYTDITDLENILNTYQSSGQFNIALGKNTARVLVWIQDFEKTRNILAHNNLVSKRDRDRLKIYAHDWHDFATRIFKENEKVIRAANKKTNG